MADIALIDRRHAELHEAFCQIFQGRSDYQLKNFVVSAHVTPERQYAQCVLELQHKYYAIKKADISRRKLQHELKTTTCPFTIEEKALDLEQIDIAMVGALKEFDTLYKIFQSLPKFSNEELQEAEAAYWAERLATQAQQDIEAHGTVSVGNAEALRQANILNGYAHRFFESMRSHPGLVQGGRDEVLSVRSQSE